ncbi:solute carrier family 2, facilitated glucose transporter member 11-like [Plectropomus leopardus]|uniref:solute carrier family 2, facilitated glucose transporter member 11-like n=1 Tax=Plectropomus leopardus TaxID=160734 RepID=UPI001C4B56A5|nr:solute carrier family 2, facilitated glucose transporter member 11-like [Plectropomus leopardus]
MNVQPMYFGESAPKHLRGAVAFSSAVFTAFGIFLGQVVGLTELLGAEPLWPYLLASNALPGLIQLLTLPWFPESPRYLLIDRGDREACVRALGRLRGGEAPVSEMEEMLQEQEEQQQKSAALNSGSAAPAKTPWSLFKDSDLQSQLRTVMAASSAMMLCGNDSIYFYASYIFLEAGIPPEKIQYVTIGTGASELTASILSNLLIERVGRRYLLLGGYSLMSCWTVVFTVALTLQSHRVAGMAYLSMACVFAYILSFGLGPAGVTGILPAEIFDQAARPAAYMVAGSCMWISLFLVGMLFPFIVRGLGNFCFLPFLAVCLMSALFLGFTLPETKGKTLAEITAEFDRKNGVKKERPDMQVDEPVQDNYQLGKACSFATLMPDPDLDQKNETEI